MNRISTTSIAFLLAILFCFGQNDFNRIQKVSKSEFKELKLKRDRFVPSDLKSTKVLIVKPSLESFEKLKRNASVAALFRNGYDTTFISTNTDFNNHEKGDAEYFQKFEKEFFQNVANKLKKKGIESEIIISGHESEYPLNDFRYLIRMDFVSTMRDPRKAWFIKPTYYFVNRADNKQFDVFLPTNFFVLDLIDQNSPSAETKK
jgi:hypothetical protein